MESLLTHNGPGRSVLFSGNQAVARACVESGVALVIGYPGTPTTPVIEMLSGSGAEMTARWAVNEKVAMDIAAGHSWAGMRSMVTLKMSGLNVAADTFLSVAASGTVGGLVLYVADDPNVYYGMVEQDSRYYALQAGIPLLAPSTPQEMLDFTRLAFDLSERTGAPVILYGTTVLANTFAPVSLGEIRRMRQKASFPFDVDRWTKAGSVRCVAQHQQAIARLEEAERLLEETSPLTVTGSRVGVVATGVAWDYLEEVLADYDLSLTRLKVGSPHPVPRRKVAEFLAAVDEVLVLEELDPVVENAVRVEATRMGKAVAIHGKDGFVPPTGDLSPERVREALSRILSRELPALPGLDLPAGRIQQGKIQRLLTFCPGCPHRNSYYALIRAMEGLGMKPSEIVVTGDIGCTILGMNEPFRICWTEVSMGNSIGLAAGFAKAGIRRPVVAVLGDGTFFHAGVPSLLDAVTSRDDLPVVILDNNWMAMTGFQETPGTRDGRSVPIPIEQVARGTGVRSVRVRNPYHVRGTIRAFKRLLRSSGVNVLVLQAPCVAKKPIPWEIPVVVNQKRCPGLAGCEKNCIEALACPALERDGERVTVSAEFCQSCGLCVHYCPKGAISRRYLRARRRKGGI